MNISERLKSSKLRRKPRPDDKATAATTTNDTQCLNVTENNNARAKTAVNNRTKATYATTNGGRTTKGKEVTKSAQRKPTRTVNPTKTVNQSKCDENLVLPIVQKNIQVNKKNKPFPISGHAGCVLYILQDTWKNKILCDVVIKVDEKSFDAHRLVLASCAGYFYEKFCGPRSSKTTTLTISDISPEIMEIILDSMYTGQLKISEKSVMDILVAARNLRYYTVEQACDEFMQGLVNKTNCYSCLEFASLHGLQGLAEACLKCIGENFEDLAKGPKYLALNLYQIVCLLSRDDLNVDRELTIFDRMLDWINCDIPNRLGYGGELLREVRLPLMAASDIIDHVETTSYLMEVNECRQLVKEALHYHCLPARQSILQNSRTKHRSAHQKDVVFAIGGAPKLQKDPISDEISAYNPKTSQWEFVTSLPKPIHHHGVAVLGGFIYVVGGESENDNKSPVNKAYRFDPRTGKWLKIADMKRARESFQLCALTNMLYAIGGRVDHRSNLADVERYNPAVDTWENVAPLTSPRRAMAAASLNGRIYIAGGTGDPLKFERYNALTDKWESRQPLSEPRFFAQLAAVNKSLYLLGGATSDESGVASGATSIQSYSPTSDTWTTLGTRLQSRAEAGCAVLNNKIYVVGGYNWDVKDRLKSAEVYDVETDTVETIGEIDVPLTGIGCCSATICDLSLKKKRQQSGEMCVEIDCNTCNFYHHCSQSSCNLPGRNNKEKSQAGNKSQDIPSERKTSQVNKKKVSKTPQITQKSTGSKYSQRYRLTRAMSCEPPSRTCGQCGNNPEPKLKLPKLIPEIKAMRE